ncbi:MAG: hypothetical protein OHK0023_02270 [Anaerolineae bacterium]
MDNPKRPFGNVPRRVLNVVVIGAGLVGIIISNQANFTAVTGFLVTAMLIGGAVLIVSLLYAKPRG